MLLSPRGGEHEEVVAVLPPGRDDNAVEIQAQPMCVELRATRVRMPDAGGDVEGDSAKSGKGDKNESNHKMKKTRSRVFTETGRPYLVRKGL